jgi:hypothetical protein
MGYGENDRTSVPNKDQISSPQRPDRSWAPTNPVALSPGIKGQGLEADPSTPASAEVKKT